MEAGLGFEVTVNRTVLRRVIRQALLVVPAFSLSTLRLQVLWFTVNDGELNVGAGNGTETLTQVLALGHDADGVGEVGIPVRLLARVVATLPDGPVKLSAREGFVTISAGSFKTTFRDLTSNDADPALPPVPAICEASVAATVLSEGFNHLALALDHSQGWGAALTGIELTTAPGLLRFAATDLRQLALVDLAAPRFSGSFADHGRSLLLSGEAANLMALLLPTEGQVQLGISDDQADFSTSTMTLRCRLQHDPYPNYRPIVNATTTRRIELSRTKLSAATGRVARLAGRAMVPTVGITVGTNEIRVRTADPGVGEASETIRATIAGDPCELGLYLWGFLAIVRRLRGNRLVIELGEPDKPITISTVEHPAFRYHVMPLAVLHLPDPQQPVNRRRW